MALAFDKGRNVFQTNAQQFRTFLLASFVGSGSASKFSALTTLVNGQVSLLEQSLQVELLGQARCALIRRVRENERAAKATSDLNCCLCHGGKEGVCVCLQECRLVLACMMEIRVILRSCVMLMMFDDVFVVVFDAGGRKNNVVSHQSQDRDPCGLVQVPVGNERGLHRQNSSGRRSESRTNSNPFEDAYAGQTEGQRLKEDWTHQRR